jgi:hypothetical protein
VVVVVVTMMMVMVVVMVVVTVMVIPTLRRRIAVGLLAVVKVALVPRRWLLRRRVVRPLRWSLGRWVRLRVPCKTAPKKKRIRSVIMGASRSNPEKIGRGIAQRINAESQKSDDSICSRRIGDEEQGISDRRIQIEKTELVQGLEKR